MKITIYNTKGWAGKTPIATNIVLDRGYALGTNEPYHVFDNFIPEERLITVDAETPFPEFWKEIDIVFDLAGSISKSAKSITSAIKQSDLVLVPIYNEVKSIKAGINTISEVQKIGKSNIVVIATKLTNKKRRDKDFDWKKTEDFKYIHSQIRNEFGNEVSVLPLKFSIVFDQMFEEEKSISELLNGSWPVANKYKKEVDMQFKNIYLLIDNYYARQKQYIEL